jgi:hypothetical protein
MAAAAAESASAFAGVLISCQPVGIARHRTWRPGQFVS